MSVRAAPIADAAAAARGERLAVLVVSCDRYADLWPVFFALFRRHWPDCPYPVYLVSNERTYDAPGVRPLAVGADRSWALNLREALERVEASRVLMVLEDFLVEAPVDSGRVARLLALAESADAHVLRLARNPGPSRSSAWSPEVGELAPGDAWRVSTQAAIWRRDALLALLRPAYSAWDFEWRGTPLSAALFPDGFLGVRESVLSYRHGVERGRWLPHGLRICAAAGVPVDLAARPAMTAAQVWARRWAGVRGRIGALLPRGLRGRVPDADVRADLAAARRELAEPAGGGERARSGAA